MSRSINARAWVVGGDSAVLDAAKRRVDLIHADTAGRNYAGRDLVARTILTATILGNSIRAESVGQPVGFFDCLERIEAAARKALSCSFR